MEDNFISQGFSISKHTENNCGLWIGFHIFQQSLGYLFTRNWGLYFEDYTPLHVSGHCSCLHTPKTFLFWWPNSQIPPSMWNGPFAHIFGKGSSMHTRAFQKFPFLSIFQCNPGGPCFRYYEARKNIFLIIEHI